jgi:hypothetical protein
MFAMGVALGGGTLELVHRLRGDGPLVLADFQTAFFVVTGVAAVATLLFLRLPNNAGHQLTRGGGGSGH